MAHRKRVTIREVAEAAGVSPATVSLVFNEKGDVAQATRDRVLEHGKRLGYKPGWISKVFRSGRTNVIGVVVGHNGTPIWEQTYLPYYRGIIAGAAMEALEFGYSITVIKAGERGELLGPMQPDGIILVDPGADDPFIQGTAEDGLAVVAAGGHSSNIQSPRLRSVSFDIQQGVPAALDALIDGDARNPAFIRGPVDDEYTLSSQRAYEEWCLGLGREPHVFVLAEGQTPIGGAREFLAKMHGVVDAAYCINESYANAITAAAGEEGVLIPDEFAVAVAAESHSARVDPRVIYLDLDPVKLGAMCARVLIQTLEEEGAADALLPLELDVFPR